MGFISGDWGGECSCFALLYSSHSLSFRTVCWETLSCWKMNWFPIPILIALNLKFCLSMSMYITWFIIPSIKCRLPIVIQPHTSTLPPPCFPVGIKFLDASSLFFIRNTMSLPSDPNMLNLLSSEKLLVSKSLSPCFCGHLHIWVVSLNSLCWWMASFWLLGHCILPLCTHYVLCLDKL